jgi:hypothetical protein
VAGERVRRSGSGPAGRRRHSVPRRAAVGATAALLITAALTGAAAVPAFGAASPIPASTTSPRPTTGQGVPGPTSTSSGNGLNGPPGASITPPPGKANPLGGDLARGATSNAEVLKLILEPSILTGGGGTDPQGQPGLQTEIDVVAARGRYVDDVVGLLSPYRKPEVDADATSGLLAGTLLGQQIPGTPGTATADFTHPQASSSGMRLPAGLPVSGGQGDSTAVVDKAGHVAKSAASGGDLTIGALGQILPSQLVSQLKSGIGSTSSGSTAATGQLNGLLGQLKTAGLPTDALDKLTAAVPDLQAALASVLDAPLLQIKDVTSTQSVSMVGRTVTSAAESKIGTITLLGGLLTISGTDSTVSAVAGGVPGSAKVTTHQIPGSVTHGSINGAVALANGLNSLTGTLAGLTCPSGAGDACANLKALGTQLSGAYAKFSSLLSLTSSSPAASKPVTNTDPGGTEADARYAGVDLLVGPPDSSGNLPTDPSKALLTIEIGVASAQSQSTAAPTVDLAATRNRLAFTGGPGPWPAAAACALGAAGLVIRRRRRAAATR